MTKTHSSQFISEMKSLLDAEKGQLEREISHTRDFAEYGRNDEDNATEISDFAASSSTHDALKERLSNVLVALERIKAGSYGLTETGEIIPEDRLRANPAATTTLK